MKPLIASGFIRGSLIAPDTRLVDLGSLFEHINATRDFEFWTQEHVREYRNQGKDYKPESDV